MRKLALGLAAAAALVAAGCQSVKVADFFGTNDPCQQAEVAYAAFSTFSTSAKARQKAAAGIAAFREQCSDGEISKVTLNKLLRAYSASLAEYRKGNL
jgi:uncharacterized protein YgiB involved in biofilm formation